jgi:hypothetical protein
LKDYALPWRRLWGVSPELLLRRRRRLPQGRVCCARPRVKERASNFGALFYDFEEAALVTGFPGRRPQVVMGRRKETGRL